MNVQEVMSPTRIVGYAQLQVSTQYQEQTLFFSKLRFPLQTWLLMLSLWAREYPVSDAAEEAEISSRVAIDIYQWLCEVCTAKLLQTQIILGGPGVVVQIDESLFRHKPKVDRKPVQLSNE